jgi:hypothetical protein
MEVLIFNGCGSRVVRNLSPLLQDLEEATFEIPKYMDVGCADYLDCALKHPNLGMMFQFADFLGYSDICSLISNTILKSCLGKSVPATLFKRVCDVRFKPYGPRFTM